MSECTEFFVERLTKGRAEEHAELVRDLMKDNKIKLLQERLREIKEETNE